MIVDFDLHLVRPVEGCPCQFQIVALDEFQRQPVRPGIDHTVGRGTVGIQDRLDLLSREIKFGSGLDDQIITGGWHEKIGFGKQRPLREQMLAQFCRGDGSFQRLEDG